MKVLVIHGQSHHGNTYQVTQLFLKQLNVSKEEIKEIWITGISQCLGCMSCILKGEEYCPHDQEIQPIVEEMKKADVIIVESPTYCMEMTGQLKSFFDHLAYCWMIHRPNDMRKKIGVTISTAAGGGAKGVTKSLKRQLFYLTVGKIYRIPFLIQADGFNKVKQERKTKLEKKMKQIAKKIHRHRKFPRDTIKTKLYFKVMTIMHQKMDWIAIEKEYWQKQGWIKKKTK